MCILNYGFLKGVLLSFRNCTFKCTAFQAISCLWSALHCALCQSISDDFDVNTSEEAAVIFWKKREIVVFFFFFFSLIMYCSSLFLKTEERLCKVPDVSDNNRDCSLNQMFHS